MEKVSKTFEVPTVTDIHSEEDAEMAAAYVDVLQVPAFLVRQTDLLVAAAKTGKFVNLKKGQFMSPESMQFAVQKVKDSGNENAWITDRGTQFGYQDLIVDFRGIPVMKEMAPTVLDVTHSLQQPNQSSGVTGGRPESIETIARAGIATGVDGLFLETHYDPSTAKSDGANMLDIQYLEGLLTRLSQLRSFVVKSFH
jgi:2-dehydro-3-deoxyphosphooctonate aldolase (KDO 8-P synthase)